jgi:signal transduction histidine kinase
MIPKYWRSFSLRAAAIIFVAFCAVLLGVRILVHVQNLKQAQQAMVHAVTSYKKELLNATTRLAGEPLLMYVQQNIEESSDDNLIVAIANPALKDDPLLIGNIDAWPVLTPTMTPQWYQFSARYDTHTTAAQAQGQLVDLGNGWHALIGYDLAPVLAVKDALWFTLAENVVYALLMAGSVSAALVWLLNRQLRRLNNAFMQIQHGHLNYRMFVHYSGDEFDILARNFNATMDWLNTLLLMIQESSNALAHDIRTPISRLRLALSRLLQQPNITQAMRGELQQHIDKLDDLIAMFDNILNIAKAETRGSKALFEQIDIHALVSSIAEFYEPLIEDKNITVHTVCDGADFILQGDKQFLSQAIMNIIDNACKYTPHGGSIFINLNKDGKNIILRIADTGGGVPEALLPRLCERFVRGDQSRTTHGHGLGLSLVQAVAKLHNGSLSISNTAQGLAVVLSLPDTLHANANDQLT